MVRLGNDQRGIYMAKKTSIFSQSQYAQYPTTCNTSTQPPIHLSQSLTSTMAERAQHLSDMPAVLTNLAKTPYISGLDEPINPSPSRKKLSDMIPHNEWWRIYIDRQNHEEAFDKDKENPGFLYDTQQSPGFQKAMVDAYTKVLDGQLFASEFESRNLSFEQYSKLYKLIESSVPNKTRNPGVKGIFGIMPPIVANDIGMVHNRILLGTKAQFKAHEATPNKLISYITKVTVEQGEHGVVVKEVEDGVVVKGVEHDVVKVEAGPEESEELITVAFKDFKTDITDAKTKREQLTAIAKLVRSLHVMHHYPDGNGRLNIFILLPRLLLEYGFGPPLKLGPRCRPETLYGLFNGCFNLEQIVAFLWHAQQLNTSFEELIV